MLEKQANTNVKSKVTFERSAKKENPSPGLMATISPRERHGSFEKAPWVGGVVTPVNAFVLVAKCSRTDDRKLGIPM